jgi:F-type H+-transporting ATPase subunit a
MDVNAPNPPTSDEPRPPAPTIPPDPNQPEQQNYFQRSWARFQNWVRSNPRRATIAGITILLFLLSFVIRAPVPHVALSGEPLMPGGWFTNTLLTVIIVDIILILVAILVGTRMKLVPSGLQNVMEAIIEYLYNLAESVARRRAATFFPWAATLFLFILVSNYSGLIPGVASIGYYHEYESHADTLGGQLAMADGKLLLAEEGAAYHFVPLFRAPSADLNVTFALSIATMVMVQVHGVRTLGGGYFRKFWNPSGQGFMKGINIFVGLLEVVTEVSRILTFAFRLFGNIFAGEVVLATMAFLITFLIPVPFYVLELVIGAVQALVFAMLALVFFTMATISHGHDEHHDEQHIEHFAEEQVLRP